MFGDKSGYGSGIVIEHRLPGGQKIYSVYEHITTSLSIGDPVYQGQTIGSVASITKLTPHLHFEIRTTLNKKDWYPNDKGRGYYSSQEKIYADGFIDPSDFIDFHRGSTNTAVAAFQLGSLGMPGFGNPMLPSPTSEDYSNSNPPEVTHPGVITVVNRPEGYPPGGNSGWVPCV